MRPNAVFEKKQYHIEPCMEYIDIIGGTVEVIRLATPAQFGEEIQELAQDYTQGFEDNPEETKKILEGMWVLYYYPNGEVSYETHVPIGIFLDHIVEVAAPPKK